MSGLPAGRGRKGGVPKRKRIIARQAPNIVVRRPAFMPVQLSDIDHSTQAVPPTAPHLVVTQCPVSTQINAIGTVSVTLSSAHDSEIVTPSNSRAIGSTLCTNPVTPSNSNLFSSPTPSLVQPYSTHPFFVKCITGNIRMCQGCRSSLRSPGGGIPNPPFDLAIARFERTPYRDRNGELKTPAREQASHYHLNVVCVHVVSPSFIPGN